MQSNYFTKKNFFFFLTIFFLIFFKSKNFSPIYDYQGDSLSYISFATSVLLDFDLDFKNEPINFEYLKYEFPPHPVGVGILSTIISFPFSLLDRIFHSDIIYDRQKFQSSWLILGMIISSIIMFYYGTLFYLKSLKIMKINIDKSIFLLIILGTGILYYVFFTPIFSHIYEYFCLSIVFFLSLKYAKNFANKDLFLLVLALTMSLLVRYNNFNSYLIPFIVILTEVFRSKKKIPNLKYFFNISACVFSSFVITNLVTYFFFEAYVFEFTKIYSLDASQKIFETSNIIGMIKTLLLSINNFFILIFTYETGTIYSNPLSFFVLFFVIFLAYNFYIEHNNKTFVILFSLLNLLFFGFPYLVALSWNSSAGMYGYRYLLSLTPLIIYNTVILLHYIKDLRIKRFIGIIIIIFSINSLISQMFADTIDNLSRKNTQNSFGIVRDGVYKDYNKNLYRELFSQNLYYETILRGVGSLIAVKLIERSNFYDLINNEKKKKYEYYFPNLNYQLFFKIFFVYFIWIVTSMKILKKMIKW
jgi:hypothetical protein